MFLDDTPPRKKAGFEPRKLVDMSVGEMSEYIEELKGEIARVEEDIKKKKASQAAANSFFKS
jgi:uncharacterized small protein (DUF1192 family)